MLKSIPNLIFDGSDGFYIIVFIRAVYLRNSDDSGIKSI